MVDQLEFSIQLPEVPLDQLVSHLRPWPSEQVMFRPKPDDLGRDLKGDAVGCPLRPFWRQHASSYVSVAVTNLVQFNMEASCMTSPGFESTYMPSVRNEEGAIRAASSGVSAQKHTSYHTLLIALLL